MRLQWIVNAHHYFMFWEFGLKSCNRKVALGAQPLKRGLCVKQYIRQYY